MPTEASNGSTASYYQLPQGATQLQDLISDRNMNAQDGEIFRAIYRKGRASPSDELRDARKVLFYAEAEVKRLEKLQGPHSVADLVEFNRIRAEASRMLRVPLDCVVSASFTPAGRLIAQLLKPEGLKLSGINFPGRSFEVTGIPGSPELTAVALGPEREK